MANQPVEVEIRGPGQSSAKPRSGTNAEQIYSVGELAADLLQLETLHSTTRLLPAVLASYAAGAPGECCSYPLVDKLFAFEMLGTV